MTRPAVAAATRRPRAPVLATTAVLFVVMVAHALLETARDALFLARLGPGQLAWAYLAIAGAALLAFFAVRRLAGLRDPRRLLIALVMIAAAGTTVLALTITRSPMLIFVLYVWTGLVATLVVPSYWTLVDRALDIDEAKHVFAFIGAGAVSGALVGSAGAALLGRVIAARHLVTVAAAVLVVAVIATVAFAPRPAPEPPRRRRHQPRTVMRGALRYLHLLVLLTVVSTVTLTLGDLAFKRVVAERLPSADLATAFGTIYTGLNVLSLLVQLVLAPRLIGRLGVGAAMWILPLVIVTTTAGFALTAMTAMIVIVKLGDGSLRHSLHRVTSEILYLPLPAEIRDAAKPVADAIGQRGGQIAAALIVLALPALAIVEVNPRVLAAMAAGAAVAWLGLVVVTRHAYVAQFSAMLAAGEIRRTRRLPRLDASAIGRLTEALASPDEREALAALDLLEPQSDLIPVLVLYHPRSAVVRRALELLEDDPRPDLVRVLDHLVEHRDPEIRARALAAARRRGNHLAELEVALADPHPDVRATAAVGLVGEPARAPAAAAAIAAMLAGTTAERVALAQAIAHAPDAALTPILRELLDRREPAVVHEVLEVYGRAPHLADLPYLLGLLADFHVRSDVRRVFLAAGAAGFDVLVAALDDPATPTAVRRHVPRTLSRFGSAAAVSALVARLPHETDATTELKILRALGRLRVDQPDLPVDETTLRRYLRRTIARAARFATLLDHLAQKPPPASAATDLLGELLRERTSDAIEHAFRTLGILHPRTDLRSVHDALTGDDAARRGAAREVAEGVLDGDTRGILFATVDDLAPEIRRLRLGPLAAGPFADHGAFLSELRADPSESLRSIAAYVAPP